MSTHNHKPVVILESPYTATSELEAKKYEEYAHIALDDSLYRDEAPFAVHILYKHLLETKVPCTTGRAISAGRAVLAMSNYMAVYVDYGVSEGMRLSISAARTYGIDVKYRKIL